MSGAISVERRTRRARPEPLQDLVLALPAARERDDVALAQLLLALVSADVGSPRRTITHSSFTWWV